MMFVRLTHFSPPDESWQSHFCTPNLGSFSFAQQLSSFFRCSVTWFLCFLHQEENEPCPSSCACGSTLVSKANVPILTVLFSVDGLVGSVAVAGGVSSFRAVRIVPDARTMSPTANKQKRRWDEADHSGLHVHARCLDSDTLCTANK